MESEVTTEKVDLILVFDRDETHAKHYQSRSVDQRSALQVSVVNAIDILLVVTLTTRF